MKNIFLAIQNRLSEIPALKYIDKDWGQLQYEQPPVKWPCALIDVANIDFKQLGRGCQQGEADITVTVANIRLVRSSSKAPMRGNAYATIDLLEEIHQALQLFSDGRHFSPLMRTNLQRVESRQRGRGGLCDDLPHRVHGGKQQPEKRLVDRRHAGDP